jgi:hypothetical protein
MNRKQGGIYGTPWLEKAAGISFVSVYGDCFGIFAGDDLSPALVLIKRVSNTLNSKNYEIS